MTSVLASYKIRQPTTVYNNGQVGDTKTSVAPADHGAWLLCDGRSLSKADYYLLWEVIGYAFGGSGDSFNLPDPAGRALAAAGAGSGLTVRAIGAEVGTETHTLTIPEMPSHNHIADTSGAHTHTINDPGHSHGGVPNQASTATNGLSNKTGNGDSTGTSTTGITIQSAGTHTHNIQNTGGSLPHNNMQPTIFLGNVFIYTGVNAY